MPRTAITVEVCDHKTGLSPSYVSFDQANGMEFLNTLEDAVLIVRNADSGDHELTVISQAVVDTDLAVADPTYTVPLGDELHLSHFPAATYNNGSNLVEIDIDDGTSTTVCVNRYT